MKFADYIKGKDRSAEGRLNDTIKRAIDSGQKVAYFTGNMKGAKSEVEFYPAYKGKGTDFVNKGDEAAIKKAGYVKYVSAKVALKRTKEHLRNVKGN